jgi:hypothetical protein
MDSAVRYQVRRISRHFNAVVHRSPTRCVLLVALVVYALLGAWLLNHVLWYVDNPDPFQYIRLAERHADGSFLNVVNGYWSPLIIWLLILPVKFFGSGVVAFKVLQLSIGAFVLVAWNKLLDVVEPPLWRGLLLFAVIPILLAHGLLTLTPDLLFVAVAMVVLSMAIHGQLFRSMRHAAWFGAIGAVLYFTKHFGLPLFLVFVVFLVVVEWYKGTVSRRTVITHCGIAFGTCLLLISPWVLAMSFKYGHFTISEASRYNRTVEVTSLQGDAAYLPVLTNGLYPIPPGAVSPWETPGDLMELTPLHPWSDPMRYSNMVSLNLLSVYYYDIRRQLGAIFLLVLLAVLVVRGARGVVMERSIILPVGFMLCLTIGYSLVLMHERYIWLNTFIMLLVLAKLLPMLLPTSRMASHVVLLLAVLLAIKRPVKQFLFTQDLDVPARDLLNAVLHPSGSMEQAYEPERLLLEAMDRMRHQGRTGSFASLESEGKLRDGYSLSLQLAHGLGAVYHGVLPTGLTVDAGRMQLEEHDVRYLVVWDGKPWDSGELVVDLPPPGPRIFQLRQRTH